MPTFVPIKPSAIATNPFNYRIARRRLVSRSPSNAPFISRKVVIMHDRPEFSRASWRIFLAARANSRTTLWREMAKRLPCTGEVKRRAVVREPAMKKSIMRATLPMDSSVVKHLDLIKKAGFDGIQLGVLNQPLSALSLRSNDADVEKLRNTLKDTGLEPHSIYLGVQFFYEDEAQRKK